MPSNPSVAQTAAFFEREAGMIKLNVVDPSNLVFSGGFDHSLPRRLSKRFFDLVYPRMTTGALFVGHNVVNKREEMGDFLDAVQKHPTMWTTIVSPSGEGMSVSLKR